MPKLVWRVGFKRREQYHDDKKSAHCGDQLEKYVEVCKIGKRSTQKPVLFITSTLLTGIPITLFKVTTRCRIQSVHPFGSSSKKSDKVRKPALFVLQYDTVNKYVFAFYPYDLAHTNSAFAFHSYLQIVILEGESDWNGDITTIKYKSSSVDDDAVNFRIVGKTKLHDFYYLLHA